MEINKFIKENYEKSIKKVKAIVKQKDYCDKCNIKLYEEVYVAAMLGEYKTFCRSCALQYEILTKLIIDIFRSKTISEADKYVKALILFVLAELFQEIKEK